MLVCQKYGAVRVIQHLPSACCQLPKKGVRLGSVQEWSALLLGAIWNRAPHVLFCGLPSAGPRAQSVRPRVGESNLVGAPLRSSLSCPDRSLGGPNSPPPQTTPDSSRIPEFSIGHALGPCTKLLAPLLQMAHLFQSSVPKWEEPARCRW